MWRCIDGHRRGGAGARPGVGYDGLTGVAATAGPGLVGGVMVGLSFGKAVALARGLPLVAVNHLEGHAVSARLARGHRLSLPAAAGLRRPLPAAGASRASAPAAGWARPSTTRPARPSTRSPRRWACPIPAGRRWRRWPRAATPARFPLPRTLLGRKDCDFSFSGLKTAAARLAEGADRPRPSARDLAAAVQAAIARQLAERTDRAMAAYARRARRPRPALRGGRRRGRQPRGPRARWRRRPPRAASASPPRRWPTAPTTPR